MTRSPGAVESAWLSGKLYELAPSCRTQDELAAKLRLTSDQYSCQCTRLRARGVAVPKFGELKRVKVNGNETTPDIPDRDGMGRIGARLTDRDEVGIDASNLPVEPLAGSAVSEDATVAPAAYTNKRWPNLAAFDADSSPPTFAGGIRRLTRADCPDGTMILWASDIHIPIHNVAATNLMVECAEQVGVSRVVLGGDILDMNCLSKHAKESHRVVAHSTILEEVEPGRPFLNWAASKECDYILGNHEDRLRRFCDENPMFHGSLVQDFSRICELPDNMNVLDGEVRLGNLSMFHGHKEFKNGTGGRHPAQKILDMFPDQSSMFGHLHRAGTAYRTTRDEDGINRTRRAWSMGHMSYEHEHYSYVSRSPNWQLGFGLIHVYWEDDRPRFNVDQIEVLSDRRNRPYFAHAGHVYR